MVDRDACRLYELFDARKVGGAWRPAVARPGTCDSNALRPAGFTSADAAGLPILPGSRALRRGGRRSHRPCPPVHDRRDAQALHLPGPALRQRRPRSASLPPMGLRVRLKASYDTSGFSPQARVIAEALKRYGMILADNGSPWYITGASDPHFDDDVMHELDVITGPRPRGRRHERAGQRPVARPAPPPVHESRPPGLDARSGKGAPLSLRALSGVAVVGFEEPALSMITG